MAPGPAAVQLTLSGGGCVQFPVTVFALGMVNLDTPAVPRATVLSQVQALLPGTGADLRFVMGPPTPVPAGSEIAPALGDLGLTYNPGLAVVTSGAAWLFYVDDHPDSAFQRDATTSPTYFLVDAASGTVASHSVSSWLSINGLNYHASVDENATSQDLLQGPAVTQLAATAITHPPTAVALLIAGSNEGSTRADVLHTISAVDNHQIPGLPDAVNALCGPPSARAVACRRRPANARPASARR